MDGDESVGDPSSYPCPSVSISSPPLPYLLPGSGAPNEPETALDHGTFLQNFQGLPPIVPIRCHSAGRAPGGRGTPHPAPAAGPVVAGGRVPYDAVRRTAIPAR